MPCVLCLQQLRNSFDHSSNFLFYKNLFHAEPLRENPEAAPSLLWGHDSMCAGRCRPARFYLRINHNQYKLEQYYCVFFRRGNGLK